MTKAKTKANPAPVKKAKRSDIVRTTYAAIIADYLMCAFDWSEHPWGHDFWNDVQSELARMDTEGDDGEVADNG